MPECHKCRYRNDPDRLERCLKCSPPKDGQPFHVGRNAVVYADAQSNLSDLRASSGRTGREGCVTQLPEDVEDVLRGALATFAGLSPVDALLAHHIISGKPMASFRDALRGLAREVTDGDRRVRRDGSDRAYAWERVKRLKGLFPPLSALLPQRRGDKGGGSRGKQSKPKYIQEELFK